MNVETLRLLVAKGLSAEDILEIAETMDAPKGRSPRSKRQIRNTEICVDTRSIPPATSWRPSARSGKPISERSGA